MKRIGLWLLGLALFSSSAAAQTPYFQGKTIQNSRRLSGRQRPRPVGADDSASADQAYSRQPRHDCSEYVRRRLDDGDQLCLHGRQT